MSKNKTYAMRLTVKPKADGACVFKPKTYNGISLAKSPDHAKKLAINLLISGIKSPVITAAEIVVRECKCVNDFIASENKD